MGASDSKLAFKQDILKLSEPKIIPLNDPYWKGVSYAISLQKVQY